MKHELHVQLAPEMFYELVDAAAECSMRDECTISPEDFAREAVESVLAQRRIERLAILS
jgi:hypothetical protein